MKTSFPAKESVKNETLAKWVRRRIVLSRVKRMKKSIPTEDVLAGL